VRKPSVMKWVCVTCVALVSLSAGSVVSLDTYQRVTAAVLVVMVALLVMSIQVNNHFLGLSVLVVTAVAFPYQFGGSERAFLNSSPFLAGIICLIWLLDVIVLRRAAPLESCRLVFAALALMVSVVTSFVAGQFPLIPLAGAPYGAQLAQVLVFFVSVGLFLIVGDLIRDVGHLKRLTWFFLVAGALVCVTHIVPTRVFPPLLNWLVRVTHQESIGSVFWIWLVAISLSQALFNRELAPPTRLAMGTLTALAVFRGLVLARSWVSGWLPPLAAMFVLLLFRLPRLAVVTAVLGALAFLYFAPGMTALTPEEEQYSAMTRLEAARVLWPFIKESPLVGLGPANYYYYVGMSPILGWYVRFNSHNQYIDLAAQLGAIGLLAFGWLVYEIAAAAWRLRARFHRDFCEAYLLGALAGLAGTIVSGGLADWILPFYYNIGLGGLRSSLLFWVFLGGIVVIRRAGHAKAALVALAGAETASVDGTTLYQVPLSTGGRG
jgi:hypothetical protein